jgi:hypothetical protein
VGDQLDTPGDGHIALVSAHRYVKSIRTYNLTIDTVHTYYVLAGATPVLVHNCGDDVSFSPKQLQKKFKHASDFGVTGNYSPANAQNFRMR